MKIKYQDIPEQEIANLIAWFAREKGKEIVIHTDDGDVNIKFTKKATTTHDVGDATLFALPAACAALLI